MAANKTSFQPGHKGGPGRTKGSRNTYKQYHDVIAKDMPKLLRRMMVDAIGGDNVAAKILLDRAWVVSTIQMLQLETELEEIRALLEAQSNESK